MNPASHGMEDNSSAPVLYMALASSINPPVRSEIPGSFAKTGTWVGSRPTLYAALRKVKFDFPFACQTLRSISSGTIFFTAASAFTRSAASSLLATGCPMTTNG